MPILSGNDYTSVLTVPVYFNSCENNFWWAIKVYCWLKTSCKSEIGPRHSSIMQHDKLFGEDIQWLREDFSCQVEKRYTQSHIHHWWLEGNMNFYEWNRVLAGSDGMSYDLCYVIRTWPLVVMLRSVSSQDSHRWQNHLLFLTATLCYCRPHAFITPPPSPPTQIHTITGRHLNYHPDTTFMCQMKELIHRRVYW